MLRIMQLLSWLKINRELGSSSEDVVLEEKKKTRVTIFIFLSLLILSSIGVWVYSSTEVAIGIILCNATMFVIILRMLNVYKN